MSTVMEALRGMTLGNRIAIIVVLAAAAHLLVLLVRRIGTWILAPGPGHRSLARRRPKLASIITLAVSATTFVIYFGALGLILGELGISLTAYFASATVIGLAIGFGSQGLVQDIVIGLKDPDTARPASRRHALRALPCRPRRTRRSTRRA